MAYSLGSDNTNKGNLRETFFYNQLQAMNKINSSKKGDFIVYERYVFEVGGSNKKFSQIADMHDSYLAVDEIEIGRGNRIPLWLFGFLY